MVRESACWRTRGGGVSGTPSTGLWQRGGWVWRQVGHCHPGEFKKPCAETATGPSPLDCLLCTAGCVEPEGLVKLMFTVATSFVGTFSVWSYWFQKWNQLLTSSLKLSSNLTDIDAILQKKRGECLHLLHCIYKQCCLKNKNPIVFCDSVARCWGVIKHSNVFPKCLRWCHHQTRTDMNVKCLCGKKINIKSHLTSS